MKTHINSKRSYFSKFFFVETLSIFYHSYSCFHGKTLPFQKTRLHRERHTWVSSELSGSGRDTSVPDLLTSRPTLVLKRRPLRRGPVRRVRCRWFGIKDVWGVLWTDTSHRPLIPEPPLHPRPNSHPSSERPTSPGPGSDFPPSQIHPALFLGPSSPHLFSCLRLTRSGRLSVVSSVRPRVRTFWREMGVVSVVRHPVPGTPGSPGSPSRPCVSVPFSSPYEKEGGCWEMGPPGREEGTTGHVQRPRRPNSRPTEVLKKE